MWKSRVPAALQLSLPSVTQNDNTLETRRKKSSSSEMKETAEETGLKIHSENEDAPRKEGNKKCRSLERQTGA